ncbi:unnamed protein product [Alopecurus aequalis]
MAEYIAMLVADEESERRLNRGADEASNGWWNFDAATKVWGSWAESAAATAAGVKVQAALLVKADVAEPKTPFALAAFNGFFSA